MSGAQRAGGRCEPARSEGGISSPRRLAERATQS